MVGKIKVVANGVEICTWEADASKVDDLQRRVKRDFGDGADEACQVAASMLLLGLPAPPEGMAAVLAMALRQPVVAEVFPDLDIVIKLSGKPPDDQIVMTVNIVGRRH